jgi:hypothetical protein
MQIRLAPSVTPEQKSAFNKYLVERRTMNERDWLHALRAFEQLGECVVLWDEGEQTFAQIYQELIDARFADEFLFRILAARQVEVEGNRLKTTMARQIFDILVERNLYQRDLSESKYLLAYCYFWWDSFARGYIFETHIFNDLKSYGISFIAHELRQRAERFSRSDLIVMGYEGDIKTSTYFLHTSRTRLLLNDFYITRLYDAYQRERILVVMLNETFWQLLDGETVESTIRQVPRVLPRAAHLDFAEGRLVVIEYEDWKARVKAKQQAGLTYEESEK